MSARSLHLARAFEVAFRDDAAPDAAEDSALQEAIAKVLLAEEGIEDFAKTDLVLVTMPRVTAERIRRTER